MSFLGNVEQTRSGGKLIALVRQAPILAFLSPAKAGRQEEFPPLGRIEK
jgi:hypothetical protein